MERGCDYIGLASVIHSRRAARGERALPRPFAAPDNAAMVAEPPIAAAPKPKRRWYQFRLRSLLIVVTLLTVPLGYVGWQAKIVRERKALLQLVVESGGYYIAVRKGEKDHLYFATASYAQSKPGGWREDRIEFVAGAEQRFDQESPGTRDFAENDFLRIEAGFPEALPILRSAHK